MAFGDFRWPLLSPCPSLVTGGGARVMTVSGPGCAYLPSAGPPHPCDYLLAAAFFLAAVLAFFTAAAADRAGSPAAHSLVV